MHAVGLAPYRKIEIEEADGSSSGQKEYELRCICSRKHLVLEVEEELSTCGHLYRAEGACIGKWHDEQKRSLDDTGSRSSDVETGDRTCRGSDVRDP